MRVAVIMIALAAGSLAAVAADVVPGVSRELARERRECLDSVRYNIDFHYPGEGNAKFAVEEEILFHYAGGLEDWLQIDFAGESVGACSVNGVATQPEWRANHILIPKELLRPGQNSIRIECAGSGKALNHNPGYMYTLFVPANAHSAFPCFDQPDLKATFTPTLHIPQGYQCMSTMPAEWEKKGDAAGFKTVAFRESPLLPTYLMSWVTGDFKASEAGGCTVMHNETDSLKTAQIPEMREIALKAINWLEDYTALPYPYGKHDFAIPPGFQFGGMEHPGAILYAPERMFLSPTPTPEEILGRYELIAHETSHMWFGDLVTMRWFDDVWTKEVFANFMASKISSEAFPEIDHNFNFIRGNYPSAYYTDRTDGTHPIAQELDNLRNAGLVYGNIIYCKAPIMMHMLEKRMGEERLRDGLRAYLRKYAEGNSSWDELVALLDSVAPDADVKGFSEAWVKKKGLPTITARFDEDGKTLGVRQEDPTGAGTVWPQSFSVLLMGTLGSKEVEVNLFDRELDMPIDTAELGSVTAVIPNSHGDGYGYFKIDDLDSYRANWDKLGNDGQYAALLNLENAWVRKEIGSGTLQEKLAALLPGIRNAITAAAAADLLGTMEAQGEIGEEVLWDAYEATQHTSVKQRLLRRIYGQCTGEASAAKLHAIWKEQGDSLLNPRDYMSMAYRLAILMPDAAAEILETQRKRIADNQNLAREFGFVSRGCTMDADELLDVLAVAENRQPEPWTTRLLSLIFDPARTPSEGQLKRALDMLPEIQATGGIFFPTQWAKALTAGLRSPESRRYLREYCRGLDAAQPLSRKLLEASYLSRQFTR